MKRSILVILLASISLFSFTQTAEKLRVIANALSNFQNYQSICQYTFSVPFGDTLTVECAITTRKVPDDGLCGFYYNVETSDSYRGELFTDFFMYFDSAVYSSYKNTVEKTSYADSPSQFFDLKLEGGFAPAIQRRSPLYNLMNYELAKQVNQILEEPELIVSEMPDTLINQEKCSRFLVKSGKTNPKFNPSAPVKREMKINMELCFSHSGFYPVFYKQEVLTNTFNSLEIASFTGTKVDFNLNENYFSEDNLLPEGWENEEGEEKDNRKQRADLVGTIAPDWQLPVLGKDEVYSSDRIRGKYALLEFTATWCGHCFEAAKMMNRLEDEFENNENIIILSIYSSDLDKKESIEKFAEKLNVRSTILYSATEVGNQYQVFGYPKFFLVSPEGKIIEHIQGFGPEVEKKLIDAISLLTE